jgi:hypothetical protein
MGRRAKESARKRELAIEFMRRIRTMDRGELHSIILKFAGEELARFFLTYAEDLMTREPARAAENGSSMLLIGYLVRCFEEELDERTVENQSPFLH